MMNQPEQQLSIVRDECELVPSLSSASCRSSTLRTLPEAATNWPGAAGIAARRLSQNLHLTAIKGKRPIRMMLLASGPWDGKFYRQYRGN